MAVLAGGVALAQNAPRARSDRRHLRPRTR